MSLVERVCRRTLGRTTGDPPCRCRTQTTEGALQVDASDCPGRGDLARESACRRTVIEVLRRSPRAEIRITADGRERWYTAEASRLLRAAARFAERVVHHDDRLADLATRRPLAAATEAAARAGTVADFAVNTDLQTAAHPHDAIDDALGTFEGPSIASARIRHTPPPSARLRETYETEETVVRIYETPEQPVPTYHLEPLEVGLGASEYELISTAAGHLASGDLGDGEYAHHAAVRAAQPTDEETGSVDRLARILRKHTSGYGVLEDLFADPAIGNVYANAPADETVLRVDVDDEPMRTNVCLTARGAAAIASRIRATSDRPFSRAAPIVDAVATGVGDADRVRVAGVTAPVTDGTAFAFRAGDTAVWRLPELVQNETIPPAPAALLALSVARGRRILVAGPRGAGKTTLLAALLWELPATERLVVLEDTPELPVRALQAADRDALSMRTATSDDGADVDPAAALRAALRLGDGALVVGEVRGEEAAVLYEAMRVGANSSAVLGTIHGDGAESVAERVVSDLGVPRSSFAATDLVATVDHTPDGRRLVALEEVTDDGFACLYEYTDDGLRATERIHRGNSRFVARLAASNETYADVRNVLAMGARNFTDQHATQPPVSPMGGVP